MCTFLIGNFLTMNKGKWKMKNEKDNKSWYFSLLIDWLLDLFIDYSIRFLFIWVSIFCFVFLFLWFIFLSFFYVLFLSCLAYLSLPSTKGQKSDNRRGAFDISFIHDLLGLFSCPEVKCKARVGTNSLGKYFWTSTKSFGALGHDFLPSHGQ